MGLSVPRLGVVGVFGRTSLVGDPGTEARPLLGLVANLERDSVESAALNFFAEPRRLGVVARGILPVLVWSSDEMEMEWGRLGVNGTGRASLLVELECGVAMTVLECVVSGGRAGVARISEQQARDAFNRGNEPSARRPTRATRSVTGSRGGV